MTLKTGVGKTFLVVSIIALMATAWWYVQTTNNFLLLGTNFWPGYEPAHIAREKGFFPSDNVRVRRHESASQVMNALLSGQIDAGALTLDEVIHLENQGLEMVIILVADISLGGDAVIMRMDRDWETAGNLRMGVEATALGAYMLHRFLELRKIDKGSVTVVSLEQSALEESFVGGNLDGVVTFDPVRSRLLAKGGLEVFSSREIPGEIIDVIAIRKDRLGKMALQIDSLRTGWDRALDWIQGDRAGALEWMADKMELSEAQADLALQLMQMPDMATGHQMMQPDGLVKKDITNLVKVMINEGLINANCVCEPEVTTN